MVATCALQSPTTSAQSTGSSLSVVCVTSQAAHGMSPHSIAAAACFAVVHTHHHELQRKAAGKDPEVRKLPGLRPALPYVAMEAAEIRKTRARDYLAASQGAIAASNFLHALVRLGIMC